MVASVSVVTHRTSQRKWRDVMHARNAIVEVYERKGIDVDDFTRRVEQFFKTCHELGDWIEEQIGHPAKDYAKSPPILELCDAVAQTAKHHTRRQTRKDPISAVVVELYGDEGRNHADISWSKESVPAGRIDALVLADQCISEWRKFFAEHSLDG